MHEKREPAIKVEVIPRRVDPKVVDKLQTDVVDLKQKSKDKQKEIDKLKSDILTQQQKIEALEEIVSP